MFFVQLRDAKTLLPIIQRNINTGSDIHSDKWRAYNRISELGFNHFKMKHKKNFVNPDMASILILKNVNVSLIGVKYQIE